MAELGLAIVGVLPVLAASVKGFKILRNSIRTARKCVKDLDDIELNIETQQVRFLNECSLLLRRAGKDEAACEAMMRDPEHPSWAVEEIIEDSIRQQLGSTYDICRKIVKKILDIAEIARRDLTCFDAVRSERQPGEPWRKAFRRKYQPLQFTFDKSNIKTTVCELKGKVDDFEGLRRQIKQFQDDKVNTSEVVTVRSNYPQLMKVQQISNEVYKALSASFKCADTAHHEHHVAVGLDVELINEVSLKMALTYSTGCDSDANIEPPVRFILRSRTIWAPDATGVVKQADIVNVTATSSPIKLTTPTASTVQAKRRKVTFASTISDDSDSDSDSNSNSAAVVVTDATKHSSTPLTGPTFDLGALSSPCQYLRQNCARRHTTARCPSYIASLQLPTASDHVFYISTYEDVVNRATSTTTTISTMMKKSTISLVEYLKAEPRDEISVVQQFRLALKLALAVLQYHSTPWLQDEWNMQQLQLMPSESDGSEDLPIYLSLKLASSASITAGVPEPDDVQMTNTAKPTLSRAEKYGINNMALFCLGKALLEIDRWRSASELFDRDNDGNLIDTVRRLALSPARLGKKYDSMIQKCLRCNFGDDTDLSRIKLVRAVYEDVVCPLEGLVNQLEGLNI